MVIDLNTCFAYKCPACFSFHIKRLCVFDIPESGELKIQCDCRSSDALFSRRKNQYSITVPCFVCGEEHKFNVSGKRLWKSDLLVYGCGLSSLDIFAVGKIDVVKGWIEEYSLILDSIMENEFED